MNLIDERNRRTEMRKIKKRNYDEIITLNANEEKSQKVRLLDEGMVVFAGGEPDFYIAKGTLQKYLNALPDDFIGTINLGHMDFATFPIVLGTWTKKDLSIVQNEDGRDSLWVDMKLDYGNPLVQALMRQTYDVGVSAEFTYTENEELTIKANKELAEGGQVAYFPVFDEIFIKAFAIVGECGNVNSDGVKLGGKMKFEEMNEILNSIQDEANDSQIEEVVKALSTEEEEPKEEPKEELAEEEAPGEEPKEEADDPSSEEKDELAEVIAEIEAMKSRIEELQTEIDTLKAANGELSAENEQLKADLSAKEEAEKEFTEKFKSLTVSVGNKAVSQRGARAFSTNDGFGEL